MLKKYIGHFIMVSLKFFFDFDPSVSNHAFFAGIILFGFLKLSIVKIADHLQDGLLTVKEDTLFLKAELTNYKGQWEGSPFRVALINNARSFKENLSEIDIRNWRLK